MRFKLFDYIIIFLSISFTVAAGLYVYTGDGGPLRVRIRSAETVYVFPLDEDREVAVEGPLGTTYIHIHDGHAAVVESPCPNKLCIQAGELDENGEWSACMPNKVFVQIEGGQDTSGVDAATY
ncbi:MAG: NusG domain II-containing protein [Sediminispirochaetaceae bacterium]